ncbi:MAG: CDP-glucose 4,6-dehydratase [Candidatus Marinimicrobia bacterium]|nr:CDP-glucose 4,6-dehydratase [Candidatus Neomarinimicrobiota bacterium]
MNSILLKNKTVLVTGNTGFKGSWLSTWLTMLGADVIGLSDQVPTRPAHHDMVKNFLKEDMRIDVRDADAVYNAINSIKPDFIFHLAAQPIVLESYRVPLETFITNTMGTAHILDALRRINHTCTAVMITSDKCYDNVEWTWGYRETDHLGGKDPYSGSKGSAELVIKSYTESFFKKTESKVRIGIGRAGNVIGGGDWAPNRIVPDCINAWSLKDKAKLRNPNSTRPWQHVLEPLSGYVTLATTLHQNSSLNGEAFNFGPPAYQNHSVGELVGELTQHWPGSDWDEMPAPTASPHEAGLLKLNCDKALHTLGWRATLNFSETARWTGNWYRTYYQEGAVAAGKLTSQQIEEFMQLAHSRHSFKIG